MDEKFSQIKNKLIISDIHEKAFRIACYLISCSKNRVCYPSEYKIAEDLHLSRNTVHEYLKELESKKIITIEKQFIGKGKKAPSKYTISKEYVVSKMSKQKRFEQLIKELHDEPEIKELFDYDWLNEEE